MCVRYVRSAGGLALIALLAGCGTALPKGGTFHPNGTDQSPLTRPASSSPVVSGSPAPSAMTTPQLNKSALDAYRAYQAAYQKAYQTNDPSGLSQVATDPLLSVVTDDIEKVRAKGEIWQFYNALNPKLQGWTANRSTTWVLDCVWTVALNKFSARTGKLLQKMPTGKKYYQVELRYGPDGWRAAQAKWGGKC